MSLIQRVYTIYHLHVFSRLCLPISGTRIRLISFFKVPFPNQKFLSLRSLSSSLSPSLSCSRRSLCLSLLG